MRRVNRLDVLQMQAIQRPHAPRICVVVDAARVPEVSFMLRCQEMVGYVAVRQERQADVVPAQVEPAPAKTTSRAGESAGSQWRVHG